MFCIQCGNETVADARFCGHCGALLAVTVNAQAPFAVAVDSTPPPAIAAAQSVSEVRAWVRYWARMFDIYLAAIVGGIAVGIVNPRAFDQPGSDQLFGLAIIFAWVFVESFF